MNAVLLVCHAIVQFVRFCKCLLACYAALTSRANHKLGRSRSPTMFNISTSILRCDSKEGSMHAQEV